jgi:hypothetical protein
MDGGTGDAFVNVACTCNRSWLLLPSMPAGEQTGDVFLHAMRVFPESLSCLPAY